MQFDRKLQLATDLYQFTMGNVYVQDGKENEEAVFDVLFATTLSRVVIPLWRLEQVIEYVNGILPQGRHGLTEKKSS